MGKNETRDAGHETRWSVRVGARSGRSALVEVTPYF